MIAGQLPSTLLGLPATAAAANGTMSGTVRDVTGAVIPGFQVRADSLDNFSITYATTDAAGIYRYSLPNGRYNIVFPSSAVMGNAFQVYNGARSYFGATT